MKQTRRVALLAGGALAGGMAVVESTPAGRRLSHRLARRVTRVARYESGRLQGLRYRLSGGSPDPAATDRVLADRVRSMLGPLEHRLDVPHAHVSAYGHVVQLHGDVGTQDEARRIVEAAGAVPGVGRVDSHLHVGYAVGDSRPSDGARAAGHPSAHPFHPVGARVGRPLRSVGS